MPSLRRSLIFYFLILTAVVTGGVGLLTHEIAKSALQARKEAERLRIMQVFQLSCQESESKFDEELLHQAQSLGRELREKYILLNRQSMDEQQRNFRNMMAVYHLGSIGQVLPTAVDYAASNHSVPNSFTFRGALFWAFFSNRETEDLIRKSFEGGEHPDYFQFHIPRLRRVIRGPRTTHPLPGDIEDYDLNLANDHTFQTVVVSEIGPMRRVILRTHLPGGQRVGFSPMRPSSGPPPVTVGPPSPPPRSERRGGDRRDPPTVDNLFPPVYVQCARPVSELSKILTGHALTRDIQLDDVRDEIRYELKSLRFQLAAIAGVAFVGVVIGGWLLIGHGLKPLNKLTDAVSRVSEKEFRLPVDKSHLSAELIPIHDRLNKALDELKRAFDREKEAVADISHELRTPVAGLLATIDVTLRKPRTSDQYKQALEDCRGITKQLSGLVERVMTLAYLDAGQTAVSTAPADAAELAHGCAAVIRPLAESHGLTLNTDVPPEAELITDSDKLREVMMNLLHNAVEYTNPGGQVKLSVRREPNTERVVVEVSDTGIGMTPEVRSKIFERFYRADSSRTATGVHAGLGLAIVKEYVDRLGGAIQVESEPGRGSTFRVLLPA